MAHEEPRAGSSNKVQQTAAKAVGAKHDCLSEKDHHHNDDVVESNTVNEPRQKKVKQIKQSLSLLSNA